MADPVPPINPDFASPAEFAFYYRAYGLQIVPAVYPMRGPGDKRPRLATWTEFHNALVPDSLFQNWFTPSAKPNMGLICGQCSGNVLVVDLDVYKSGEATLWWEYATGGIEPETWRQTTGGGGKQVLLRAPPDVTIHNASTNIGVDIRGQGGFAMLPPSQHMSGRDYAWDEGFAPWDCSIADVHADLLQAILALTADNPSPGGNERTEAPVGTYDAWGNLIDGREKALAAWVWRAVLELHRRTGDVLLENVAQEAFEECLAQWERHTRTRIVSAASNAEGLEREGRGRSAMLVKWRHAMRKWHAKVAEEAAKPNPKRGATGDEEAGHSGTNGGSSGGYSSFNGTIRTFDFANLVLADVPETPDYIEKDLLGHGSFLLIGGPPKAQKTWLKQDVLVALATGQPILSGMFHVPRALRVFDLQAEMNEKLLRRRAKAMIDLTDEQLDQLASNLIVSDRFRMILNEDGVRVASELIKGCFPADQPPDVISFDPMANLFDQDNENDNAQIMRFLTTRIESVRQLVNPVAGIILVHHATKRGPDEIRKDPFNCFRGGGALRGHYDSGIIIFKKNEESDEREVHFELRGGESPEPVTVKLENGRMIKAGGVFFGERKGWPDQETQRRILDDIDLAWCRGSPWANTPESKRYGRYAPAIIHRDFPSIKLRVAEELINSWLMPEGCLIVDTVDKHSKKTGLRVVRK